MPGICYAQNTGLLLVIPGARSTVTASSIDYVRCKESDSKALSDSGLDAKMSRSKLALLGTSI